ncbi:MAG TPA: hypothetical protein VFW25_04755 [Silvibacterium sp.]|nr:hypothetical protein [Silvibacterium sp.]
MPSGRRCRAVALRNQRFCRSHAATHGLYERENIVGPTLDRLAAKAAEMTTDELLGFLHEKLGRLQKTMNRFPDVRYILIAALDRITEITQMESILKQQIQQNHMLLAQLCQSQSESHTCMQVPPAHTDTPLRRF